MAEETLRINHFPNKQRYYLEDHVSQSIGVVIPVFNRKNILLHCLQSVVEQTSRPTRLVVCDDGSSDGSADAAERYLTERSPRFDWQVLRLPHRSASAARNDGYQQVSSMDYVAFLDSDDCWPVDFLERAIKLLQSEPEAVAASADRRYVSDGSETQPTDCRPMVSDPIGWFFAHGAGVASCSVFRTDAVTAAGGWVPELLTAEDVFLFSRVAERGAWLHLPGCPVEFHINANDSKRSEEINLSSRYPDSHSRWTPVYEQIYHRVCPDRSLKQRIELQRSLAYRWSAAGKQNQLLGNRVEAKKCFLRSLRWYPLQLNSYRRLARLSFLA